MTSMASLVPSLPDGTAVRSVRAAAAGSRVRAAIVAGAAAGVAASLVFVTAHAIIIVPIWRRVGLGVGTAVLAGAVAGWGFAAMRFIPDGDRARSWRAHATSGLLYGLLLWLSIVPVTLADSLLRLSGWSRPEMLDVIVAVLLALAGGALLGAWRAGTRQAMIAGAAAALFLTITMAGPVPLPNGRRAVGIFLATLPASLVAGVTLGLTLRALSRVHPH
jgi:hypothetical protein